MGYSENAEKARQREIDKVTSGRGNPGSFNTIGGKMAHDRWKVDHPAPKSSSWSAPSPIPPIHTSRPSHGIPLAGNPYASPQFPLPARAPQPLRPYVPDWTDQLMQRIPHWLLAVCAVLGALIGFAIGASSGGATAIVYAFLGAFAGLLALPAAIKLTQLALRILAVAAVLGVVFFIFWVLAHGGK
jgi:hypothetical protein